MAMIIQVGEKSDMKPVPSNFPKCGDYMPEPLLDGDNNIVDPETDEGNTSNIFRSSLWISAIFSAFIGILLGY